MTRTQFAVALVVLFVGGIAGGMLSDRMRGGTVAYAQDTEEPMRVGNLVVKKLVVLESATVQDDEGSVLIRPDLIGIGTGAEADPRLVLSAGHWSASSGQVRAALDMGSGGAVLSLGTGDIESQAGLSLSYRSDGGCMVRFSGQDTDEGFALYCLPRTGPGIDLKDRAGNARITLGQNDNGTWQVGVWDADGRGRTLTAGF